MNNDIAIIGIAGRFPEASTLEQFGRNLQQGRDSARELSLRRKAATSLPPDRDYKPFAYLENVEQFDYRFFGISLHEAELMDPHQRIILEQAYHTFESTGYSVDHFNGSNTAVYLASVMLRYHEHAEKFDPNLIMGNLPAATAGRVARFFNLRGNAVMVDTACSSSLVALHMACGELAQAETEYALVGGVRLNLFPPSREDPFDIGVTSPDGKTCSFSADANGSGAGEAAVCLLLRRLPDALADKDIVYAVIKGTAVNQDAQLSGSLTAPSSVAQAEVIRKAWQRAGVPPQTVTYIEAHGSATKLGDPTEIGGIELAFGNTTQKHFCAVSSVKSNIGHTGSMAGLCGLAKAVLSLQYRQLFPTGNYTAPNPFITLHNQPFYINDRLREWVPAEGSPRRAGVSSFGLSGTNCHVVLEEAPPDLPTGPPPEQEDAPAYLFTISAKSAQALQNNRKALLTFLGKGEARNLGAVSYTLNCGRKHYPYRLAVVASGVAQLTEQLERQQAAPPVRRECTKLIFTFSGDLAVAGETIRDFEEAFPVFRSALQQCRQVAPLGGEDARFQRFAFQYGCYQVFASTGIATTNLLGTGTGRLVVETITGEKSLAESLSLALVQAEEVLPDFAERLRKLVAQETEAEKVIFLETGPESQISGALRRLAADGEEGSYAVVSMEATGQQGLLETVKSLYLSGYPINWAQFYQAKPARKTFLPGYQFEAFPCWIKPAGEKGLVHAPPALPADTQAKPLPQTRQVALSITDCNLPAHWSETEKQIASIWKQVLKLEEVQLDDDFFKLGGQSLYAMQVVNRIQQRYNRILAFNNVFVFATVRSQAGYVDQHLQTEALEEAPGEILPLPLRDYYEISRAQSRLWLLDQFEEEKVNYILSVPFVWQGPLHLEAFKKALSALFERHESLRTTFTAIAGVPKQKVHPVALFPVPLDYTDVSGREDADQAARATVESETWVPFNLETGPLVRMKLIKVAEAKHIFVFSIHHIIADGWTLDIINLEIRQLYGACLLGIGDPLPPLAFQQKDYAAWHNNRLASSAIQRQRSYWLQKFAGPVPELALPYDYPRPDVKSPHGDAVICDLDPATSNGLRQISLERGASLFITMLACMKALLYRYTNQRDLVVGTISAGRDHTGLENQVGFYVNTFAIRTSVGENPTFESLHAAVKQNTLEAFANQLYQFDMLVDDLKLKRQVNRNPLFDVSVEFRNTDPLLGEQEPTREQEAFGKDVSINYYPLTDTFMRFDLTLRIAEADDGMIHLRFEYHTKLFRRETIELFKERYVRLVQAVVATPAIGIEEVPLNDSPEGSRVLTDVEDIFQNSFEF